MKIVMALFSIFLLGAFASGRGHKSYGYVPDSATAIRVAESALIPVYGKKQIESERPFTAQLKDDTWTVWGSLHCSDGKGGNCRRLCRRCRTRGDFEER